MNYRIIKFSIVSVLSIILVSGFSSKIEGEIKGAHGQELIFSFLGSSQVTDIDTIQLNDKGQFEIAPSLDQMGFYRLFLSEKQFVVLILGPGDAIKIESEVSEFGKSYSLKGRGATESNKMKELNSMLIAHYQKLQALQQKQLSYSQKLNKQNTLQNAISDSLVRFANEHSNSLAGLAAVQQLPAKKHLKLYQKVRDDLKEELGESEYLSNLEKLIRDASYLSVGTPAPEIAFEDTSGKVVKLSSLRGKVVLIDFWASWCGPCIREIPNVKRAYEKYHDKGFEIYGVSLDKSKKSWIGAINRLGLPWVNVSDLKYWKSDAVKLYQFQGIPYTCLIDKEGNILAKNLRGPNLEKKLSEIFKE